MTRGMKLDDKIKDKGGTREPRMTSENNNNNNNNNKGLRFRRHDLDIKINAQFFKQIFINKEIRWAISVFFFFIYFYFKIWV